MAIHQVLEHNRTIDWVEARHPKWLSTPLARELTMGTLRHVFTLTAAVDGHLQRPLKPKDRILHALMLVGAYQLAYTNVKDHAAIHETVAACRTVGRPWATRLVNAVLRNLQRNTPTNHKRSFDHFDHPDWLIELLASQYEDHDKLLQANNTRAPMSLRVNLARTSRGDYQRALDNAGIEYEPGASENGDEACLVLKQAQRAETLPGWTEGEVAVQDRGAQLAASVLWPRLKESHKAIHRLLDACAAPGGKLFHLTELCAAHDVALEATGLDHSAQRQAATRTIGERLGHRSGLLTGDATSRDWWDGKPFDVILLDAPCSGTGTLRRHPDIKVLLTPQKLEEHCRLQARLLRNLWSLLTPGGTLLYCTCSVLEQENDLIVEAFVDEAPSAVISPVALPTGRPTRRGWQLLPTDPTTDGFYVSLLEKPRTTEADAP